MSNELTNNYVVDGDTGEITQYLTKKEKQYLDNNYTSANPNNSKLNDTDVRKSSDIFYMFISEMCGSFYHNYYNKVIPHKFVFRYLYLCTFMNYKGYLEYGSSKGENRLVTKKDMIEILKLKNKQFYDTFNYFIENKMIIEDENFIKINNELCKKGSIGKNNGVIRMFNDAIRYVYENSSSNEHNKIGMLIKLLPYVHFNTNIICNNPDEEKEELIKPLKQKEIIELLGISKPTISSLLNIKILSGSEYAFVKFSNGSFKNIYVINPRFAFKGNDSKWIENNLAYFKIGLKK